MHFFLDLHLWVGFTLNVVMSYPLVGFCFSVMSYVALVNCSLDPCVKISDLIKFMDRQPNVKMWEMWLHFDFSSQRWWLRKDGKWMFYFKLTWHVVLMKVCIVLKIQVNWWLEVRFIPFSTKQNKKQYLSCKVYSWVRCFFFFKENYNLLQIWF